MRYVMCDLEFQGQGHKTETFCEISDLVISDTKRKFLSHYTTKDTYHAKCVASCLNLSFKVRGQDHKMEVYFFNFPRIDSVETDTKFTFLSHRHQEILNNV